MSPQVQPRPVLRNSPALFYSTLPPSSGNILSLHPLHSLFATEQSVFFVKEIGFTISEKDKQHINKPDMFHLLLADISLKYKYGRLVLEIPLPSRNEKCLFFLRPMLMSVGDLIADVQREDPGVTASVFSKGGSSS